MVAIAKTIETQTPSVYLHKAGFFQKGCEEFFWVATSRVYVEFLCSCYPDATFFVREDNDSGEIQVMVSDSTGNKQKIIAIFPL